MSFFRKPQTHLVRRALFQIHLWTGLAVALYVILIGVTGAALVFRPEMQAAAFPGFFSIDRHGQPDASPAEIIAHLHQRYPNAQFDGVDFPTYRRDSVLSYLTRDGQLLTVFSNPVTGEVIGELPKSSWITQVQDLHFDLLSGPTGRTTNGVIALSLVVMFATGLVIWWPGVARWRRSLKVDFRLGWRRSIWDLHKVVGFWLFGLLMLWAVTGVEFAFPRPFRATVNAVSPLTVTKTPVSGPVTAMRPAAAPTALAARARELVPGAILARIILPSSLSGASSVLMARERHGDFDTSDEVLLYFDQYTGELLGRRVAANEASSVGDLLLKWIGPLHVGSFGGWPIKVLWSLLALSFPILAVTGVTLWWNRVIRGARS